MPNVTATVHQFLRYFFVGAFAVFWCAFLLLFPFTYASLASYQNFVLNAYVWLLLGILFRLPELQAQEQLRTPVNCQTVTHAR